MCGWDAAVGVGERAGPEDDDESNLRVNCIGLGECYPGSKTASCWRNSGRARGPVTDGALGSGPRDAVG